MINGRIGDHALQVRLRHGGKSTEHDTRHRQSTQHGRCRGELRGEKRPEDPEETVDAHFGHDAGQEHRSAGRGFGIRGGQPSMARIEGHFHGETKQHAEKNYAEGGAADFRREAPIMSEGGELHKIKSSGRGEERGESQQHEDTAADGIDDKLIGRASGPRTTPEFNEEKRWDEAEFPENKPREEI